MAKKFLKVLVNVYDETNRQFTAGTRWSDISSRFINNGIHYMGLGTDADKY